MSTLFFRYDSNNEGEDLANTISTVFLIPLSNIKVEDVWFSDIKSKKKIESYSMKELLISTVCTIKRVPSMSIVELPVDFDSDKLFINAFKDRYLGTLISKVTKAELIELAKLQDNYWYCDNIEGWLSPQINTQAEIFQKCGLSSKQVKELDKLVKVYKKEVLSWSKNHLADIKKTILPLTKFIKRKY